MDIKIRIFVGDRPIEELSPEEFAAFQQQTVERMGNALNEYYSLHPEEYKKVPVEG